MAKWLARIPDAAALTMQWLELEMIERTPELVSIAELLHEARTEVEDEARARSLSIVVVPVPDEVCVCRRHVVFVVAMLLRTAIGLTSKGERIAVTTQEFDHELVFAVYDKGAYGTPSGRFNYVAVEAAYALGGRVWNAHAPEGNLAFFSLPLAAAHN